MTTTDPTLQVPGSLTEMKLVYRILHMNLSKHTELMDGDFLDALQRELQTLAQRDGVNVADHSAWDEWLGNSGASPCEQRLQNRSIIEP